MTAAAAGASCAAWIIGDVANGTKLTKHGVAPYGLFPLIIIRSGNIVLDTATTDMTNSTPQIKQKNRGDLGLYLVDKNEAKINNEGIRLSQGNGTLSSPPISKDL